jgi:4a-hydroxytetrahydrobiopterin dehydratase
MSDLTQKKCVPCEGGAKALSKQEADRLLTQVPGWTLAADGKAIRRDWVCKDFVSALSFFSEVGQLAEKEGHHPDLHLTGYRRAAIEMSTHAIGGLSENDFIMAAKINQVPVATKK